MRKQFFIFIILLFSITAFAKINVAVSIPPQKYFVQKIAGNKADIGVIVQQEAGLSDHQLTPKQEALLSDADIFFTVGDPAERAWFSGLKNVNKQMLVVDTDTGIEKLDMDGGAKPQAVADDDDSPNTGKDPHIWLDPVLVMKQAKAIYDAFVYADKANAAYYKANYNQFLKELKALDKNIGIILKHAEVRKFMVFHPAWSYFAKRYSLQQVTVSLEDKSPKPQEVSSIIKRAKENSLGIIFGLPQFSMKDIKTISDESGARVMIIDPLAENWAEYLTKTAMVIANN